MSGERGAQRFDGERRRVLFTRGQTLKGAHDVLSFKPRRIGGRQSFNHVGERRAAGERRRATIGEETRGFDVAAAYAQSQTQAVAADGIRAFGDRIGVGELTGVARVREMIGEGGGVGHDDSVETRRGGNKAAGSGRQAEGYRNIQSS